MSEQYDQVAIFEWAKMSEGKYPDLWLLHAIPNAGKRSKRMGAWYKAEGLKPGCLDFNLPVARGTFNGLWIEQKFGKNDLTDKQAEWVLRLAAAGNCVCVSWSVEDSIEILKAYLLREGQRVLDAHVAALHLARAAAPTGEGTQ